MSQYWELTTTVVKFNHARADDIVDAINNEWAEDAEPNIDTDLSVDNTRGYLCHTAKDNLRGDPERKAKAIAQAVMLANGGPCEVDVACYYLERDPDERESFTAKDYAAWLAAGDVGTCRHCAGAIRRDKFGAWLDATGGDVCAAHDDDAHEVTPTPR